MGISGLCGEVRWRSPCCQQWPCSLPCPLLLRTWMAHFIPSLATRQEPVRNITSGLSPDLLGQDCPVPTMHITTGELLLWPLPATALAAFPTCYEMCVLFTRLEPWSPVLSLQLSSFKPLCQSYLLSDSRQDPSRKTLPPQTCFRMVRAVPCVRPVLREVTACSLNKTAQSLARALRPASSAHVVMPA